MKKEFINAQDGYRLELHIFEAEGARAAVQIVHGMEEHQKRYEDFAGFLQEHGFTVISSDMRGHGRSAETLGYFMDKNGYAALVEDQRIVTDFIKEWFPPPPFYTSCTAAQRSDPGPGFPTVQTSNPRHF